MRRNNLAAFTLAEVTLAIGIASFGMLAIFGLLPVGVNSNNTSIEQTAASGLSSTIISDLRATPKSTPPTAQNSPRFNIPIPATGSVTRTLFLKEDGAAAGAVDANASAATSPRYRATISLGAPSSAAQKSSTSVRILITWPALADSTAASTPSKFSGYFETVTALDRN